MKRIVLLLALSIAALAIAGAALADDMMGKMPKHHGKMAKSMKSMFMIESPHTDAECMNVMDEVNKSGPKELSNWQWGCMSGNHTAYRMVMAADENAAMAMVPADVRAKAHAYKISKMTPEMLEMAHKGKM